MLKNIILGFLVVLVFGACNNAAKPYMQDGMKGFGEKITAKGAISYDQLLKKMEDKEEVSTKVIGKIESVCQVKGCWMNIVSEESGKEEMFVKFKDYGFFMPLECTGQRAIMEGKAFREVTSVEELRHYAEDEGASPEEIAKITEPEEELKFLAHGVLLIEDKK